MRRIVHNYDKVMLDDGLFFGRGIFETILCKEKTNIFRRAFTEIKKRYDGIKFTAISGRKIFKRSFK